MQRIRIACAVAGLMISGAALGQGSPLASEVQGAYARVKPNIVKAAEKMPPEDYSYKPTPDIRTFARVVNHVTEAQFHICGCIEQHSSKRRAESAGGNRGQGDHPGGTECLFCRV